MNTITITVKSVNIVKTGVKKDGMPYMFLNVVDENDKKYGTFDEEYLKAVGKTITINYIEEEQGSNPKNSGKPYKSRKIVEPKSPQVTTALSPTQAWAEKLVAKVKELDLRVKKLEDDYEVVEEEEERPSLDDEIKPEDIPF